MNKKGVDNKSFKSVLSEALAIPETDISIHAEQAIIYWIEGLPPMQLEWEEDIHGVPNPNGVARNELRAEIKEALYSLAE